MKVLTLAFILISIGVSAQEYTLREYIKDDYLKTQCPKLVATFVAGASNGFGEVLLHHYPIFETKHPQLDPQFWNPRVSHTNKWKNGDKSQGEAFLMSSDWLVWTTDAYHLNRMLERVSIVAAIVIPINKNQRKKKKFKHYAFDSCAYWVTYGLGFYSTYSIFYK